MNDLRTLTPATASTEFDRAEMRRSTDDFLAKAATLHTVLDRLEAEVAELQRRSAVEPRR